MKKTLMGAVLAASIAAISAVSANATVINFDDLSPGDGTQLVNGYAGFNYNNFYALQSSFEPTSGYMPGTVSQGNVGYNGFGDPASIMSTNPANNFTLNSFYATAAWNDDLELLIEGFNDGIFAISAQVTLSAVAATLVTLNWGGIDSVVFTSFGGTHHDGYNGSGPHVAFDDIAINVSTVPLPAALPLFAAGLAGIGGLAARKRSKTAA